MSVEAITLGCRLNFAESETIVRNSKTDEEWIVVNSCAVTNEACARHDRPSATLIDADRTPGSW